MKKKQKWLLLLSILLAPSLITPIVAPAQPVYAADKVLDRPNLYIDSKGKVDVQQSDGTVEKKATLVTEFITKYRVVIAGISGVGAVSFILFFILNFIEIGAWASSVEPGMRAVKVRALMASAVGAAGLGAVSLITGLFYNAL
jgi:hypothetical protein